jgi:hypothetical protein
MSYIVDFEPKREHPADAGRGTGIIISVSAALSSDMIQVTVASYCVAYIVYSFFWMFRFSND